MTAVWISITHITQFRPAPRFTETPVPAPKEHKYIGHRLALKTEESREIRRTVWQA
jgi:hypothetical protein